VELGEAFRQLRQHLRTLLDERTRMLAAIAHDYRTYLTRMDLRSEFIEDEEQRALAAKDIEEMRDLLSDTLTFARNRPRPTWTWRHATFAPNWRWSPKSAYSATSMWTSRPCPMPSMPMSPIFPSSA
jgi:hypothetical protein